jgi:uncharacterized membrane protein HdeD (DUF308 family)
VAHDGEMATRLGLPGIPAFAESIALGILFVISPLTGLVVTAWWIGAGALIYGVLQIVAALKLRALK